MNKEEIIKAFQEWGKSSSFYRNYAIPFFTKNEEGIKMMDMLVRKKFRSPAELQLFMRTSIGVK